MQTKSRFLVPANLMLQSVNRAKNPQRLSNFARRRSCWWRWRRFVQDFVSYTFTAFRILLGEADCDTGAEAEEMGNVTSTGTLNF